MLMNSISSVPRSGLYQRMPMQAPQQMNAIGSRSFQPMPMPEFQTMPFGGGKGGVSQIGAGPSKGGAGTPVMPTGINQMSGLSRAPMYGSGGF